MDTQDWEPGIPIKCSVCGEVRVCAYCDTDNNNAPVCVECYRKSREDEPCPVCGRV